jgi:hypothetical protein
LNTKTVEISIKESRLDIIPEHTQEERRELKHSIMIEGQKIPIVIDQNACVVDGRARFEICQELGRECKFTIEHFKNESDAVRFMITTNLKRRNLNIFRRIESYMELYKILSAEKHSNRGKRDIEKPKKTVEIIADESKISARTISSAMWLLKHADEITLNGLRTDRESINGAWLKLHGYDKSRQSPGCRGVTIGILFKFFKPGSEEYSTLTELIQKYREMSNHA